MKFGVQEPPDDYCIYNRKRADGTYPSMSAFFDRAIVEANNGAKEPSRRPLSECPDALQEICEVCCWRHDCK